MKCPKCGKENDKSRRTCKYCGTELRSRRDPVLIGMSIFTAVLLLVFIALVASNPHYESKPATVVSSTDTSTTKENSSAGLTDSKEDESQDKKIERPAEYVTFSDDALKYAVQRSMGTGEREITISEARAVTSLNLSGAEKNPYGRISDLTGLSEFRILTELDLSDNVVSDISEIGGLVNLKDLQLEKNRISDLTPLKGLTDLNRLDLFINDISDISPLAELTGLKILDIRNNNISDIEALKKLNNLRELYIGMNHISDVTPIEGLTSITYLNMGYNRIEDISKIKGLKDLEVLVVKSNIITDISIVKEFDKLYHLEIADNPIEDYSVLDQLSDRVEVDVDL